MPKILISIVGENVTIFMGSNKLIKHISFFKGNTKEEIRKEIEAVMSVE